MWPRRRCLPHGGARAFQHVLGQRPQQVAGQGFRIGHLGDFNDLTLMGTLSGVEMGFVVAGVPYAKGGTQAALDYLAKA